MSDTRRLDLEMKLNVVKQLMIDILPIVFLAALWLSICVDDSHGPHASLTSALVGVSFLFFTVGTIPVFVYAVRRARDLGEFDIWPLWGKVSGVLRGMSVIALILCIAFDLMLIASFLDVMIFSWF